MTKREREILEADAAKVRPEIAFKLGKIVVIDEILSIMDDAVQNNQSISGEALSISMFLIYRDVQSRLSKEVSDAYQ